MSLGGIQTINLSSSCTVWVVGRMKDVTDLKESLLDIMVGAILQLSFMFRSKIDQSLHSLTSTSYIY